MKEEEIDAKIKGESCSSLQYYRRKIPEKHLGDIQGETMVADDFNNSYSGPSMFQHISLILFLPTKCQRERLFEIFIVIIFSKIVRHVLVI